MFYILNKHLNTSKLKWIKFIHIKVISCALLTLLSVTIKVFL